MILIKKIIIIFSQTIMKAHQMDIIIGMIQMVLMKNKINIYYVIIFILDFIFIIVLIISKIYYEFCVNISKKTLYILINYFF